MTYVWGGGEREGERERISSILAVFGPKNCSFFT